jgi:hypothetical protein
VLHKCSRTKDLQQRWFSFETVRTIVKATARGDNILPYAGP